MPWKSTVVGEAGMARGLVVALLTMRGPRRAPYSEGRTGTSRTRGRVRGAVRWGKGKSPLLLSGRRQEG